MDSAELIDRGRSLADNLTSTQLPPPWWLVLATGAVAFLLVAYTPVWRVTRAAVTIAHEGGHAGVALLSGRRLSAITLHSDTSGLTVSSGKPYGIGMILTAFAGYPAPPLVGLGFAALLGADRITLVLWTTIVLLAAMLIKIRNLYGALTVFVVGGAVFAVSWFGSDLLQAGFAYLTTWFLLIAGIRPVVELQRTRSRDRSRDSDADQLAGLTRLPAVFWVLVFAALAMFALLIGGRMLLADATGVCVPYLSDARCSGPEVTAP
ncbi:M50 family metallopeptidase [Nocardia jiangsuensis]|uniref:M50 family metallopeptidase n=1 Tax=Nocardia jiangsuensis TaxID=1691563 RepID=A0ABV8DY01_9NOCA